MTIFEAKPLKSAVKSRAKQYEDLKGQVETLKKEFQGIVDLDEEMAGSGATAIKNFYRAQVEVAHAWIELFTTQISFLKGIPAILEDADLSGETVVEVPFLEGEVTHGLSNAKSMVNQQSNDLQKIFQTIDDILPLTVFKQEDFHEKMEKAQKEKNDTIKKVHEVDNKLVEEYQVTEAQESVAISLFQALLEATSQDGTVSPMNFNQSAFQASQAYQVKDEVAENMQGYRDFKKQEEEARKLEQEMEELENRPWYEKAWDATKTFTGEITGYYDSVRATTGVDPVTGRKLSEAERIAAGAMAAAGFIPIVGWAGRAVKGGSAIYKTAKGFNAAENALDAYKSSKGLDILQKTEYGLYGLTAANGLGEAITGKDMFGNELTEEQRQNSLMNALGIAGVAGAAKVADKMASGTKFIPYSKEFVQNQVQKAQDSIKDMGKAIGKVEVPTGVKVRTVADTTGNTYKNISVDKTTIKDLAQKITAKSDGSKAKSTGKAKPFGKYSTAIDDKVKVFEKVDLADWISESFTDSNYRTVVTEENIKFYRTYGGGAKASGAFVTTSPAGNRLNAKVSTALVPDWKNSRQYEAVIEVPKGQVLNIGRVEKQYTKTGALLEGNGDQILLPQGWPSEWIKETREVPSR